MHPKPPIAPHVQAAVSAVQAKVSPASAGSRGPAAHVQAALAQAGARGPSPGGHVQAMMAAGKAPVFFSPLPSATGSQASGSQASGSPTPSSHVQASVGSVQRMRAPAAVRAPAAHVQAAVGSVQARMAVPGAGGPTRPPAVVQRADRPLPNAVGYGSLRLTYTDEELAAAARQTGWDEGYSGHLSGKKGDGVSGATERAQKDIAAAARGNREKAKAAKKKGPVRESAPMSDEAKVYNKARLLHVDVTEHGKDAEAARQEYSDYLDRKFAEEVITETDWDRGYAYFEALLRGEDV